MPNDEADKKVILLRSTVGFRLSEYMDQLGYNSSMALICHLIHLGYKYACQGVSMNIANENNIPTQ